MYLASRRAWLGPESGRAPGDFDPRRMRPNLRPLFSRGGPREAHPHVRSEGATCRWATSQSCLRRWFDSIAAARGSRIRLSSPRDPCLPPCLSPYQAYHRGSRQSVTTSRPHDAKMGASTGSSTVPELVQRIAHCIGSRIFFWNCAGFCPLSVP